MIVFESVTKAYGEQTALSSVSFTVNPGEFVFVVGPSGAGKSTLAKLLLKEIEPTSGTIKVGEFDYASIKPRDIPFLRRQIGIVFQDNKLLPDRTVAENIAISFEIMGKSDAIIEPAIQDLLRVTNLVGKDNFFPRQLSGGELQRVVIARALAMDPPVLFADEPTGNLDTETAMQIVDLLSKINQQGTTILMATHDLSLVKRMKRRTLHIKQGQLVEDSKSHEPIDKKESHE